MSREPERKHVSDKETLVHSGPKAEVKAAVQRDSAQGSGDAELVIPQPASRGVYLIPHVVNYPSKVAPTCRFEYKSKQALTSGDCMRV